MNEELYRDWGEASTIVDQLTEEISSQNLMEDNEAQTRFHIIDRLIRDVLGWRGGQIRLEQQAGSEGYIDYLLSAGDHKIVIEAKSLGKSFPSPSFKPKLKLSGNALGKGEIAKAIRQAIEYVESQDATLVVVTNGDCWCIFAPEESYSETYATVLFPLTKPGHGDIFFNLLSVLGVTTGSIDRFTNRPSLEERYLRLANQDSDIRVDRNNLADHIAPALETALNADSMLQDINQLASCFVTNEARTKYDKQLEIYLSDPRTRILKPAPRLKTGKSNSDIEQLFIGNKPNYAPPVTVLIGSVGAGKSTYLKHFELVKGRPILDQRNAHWVYIDFESMGPGGNVRSFLYERLRDYLNAEHPNNPTDYKNLIQPAYEEEINQLARGPLAIVAKDKEQFEKKISEIIYNDYIAIEPYVDKLFKHISKNHLCIVVLDNIDLYEDSDLERKVFAEGLSFSKRAFAHVIVSIRDKTYVRHMTDSTFDAYDLRKLWLDPPRLRSVISKRLSYSQMLLRDKSVTIRTSNGINLRVPSIADFFEIVQRSVLSGRAGEFIESMADTNVRRGLSMITHFLTSGHIEADRAIRKYVDGARSYTFPFHEVFKGSMLGQWKHLREGRSELVNLFDAKHGSRKLRLLRLLLLDFLAKRAQIESTVEVPVADCIELCSHYAAAPHHVIDTLNFLYDSSLIRNVHLDHIGSESTVVITKSGGYYIKFLSATFPYVEVCMFDTAIDTQTDESLWDELISLTSTIDHTFRLPVRMQYRKERISLFLGYLQDLENEMFEDSGLAPQGSIIASLSERVLAETDHAIRQATKYYS